MQHGPQITSAWNGEYYDYSDNFQYLLPLFNYADFVIGNLETTFNGPPYTGYPAFCAPDDLAKALKEASIDILVTANNHSFDKGISGVVRTIDVLDSLYINHTGTFKNFADFQKNNPLLIQKGNIRIALLNYTYGTNVGIPRSEVIINVIDTNEIRDDISLAKSYNPDGIIIFFHWGEEYKRLPNNYQKEIANFCIKNGANYLIGSHPHVIQPMIKNVLDSANNAESVVYYSLGNFISNQRNMHTDGGAISYLEFTKTKNNLQISKSGYFLSWTWKKLVNDKYIYINLPAWEYDRITDEYPDDKAAMKTFLDSSRNLLNKYNYGIDEYYFDKDNNKLILLKRN
jgi:poly-gamma-glutamate synthesis protein (capsule biosynthesis protein)